MEEPFEPMDRASLKYVTLKMVFLVALATAQLRSEFHDLSYEKISFNKERGVQLAPVPGFLVKNQAPNTSQHLVIIPSLYVVWMQELFYRECLHRFRCVHSTVHSKYFHHFQNIKNASISIIGFKNK
jgi:hypothetical protein